MSSQHIIIVGAGVGGLSTAAELSRSGCSVTVLEAHVYPGGCAGTFYHGGYRFDAGATLAGGFAPGMPLDALARRFGIDWEARQEPAAMQVHLAPKETVTRWNEPDAWRRERLARFGPAGENFWAWQDRTADRLWELARLHLAWPPQNATDLAQGLQKGGRWLLNLARQGALGQLPGLLRDAFQPVAKRLPETIDERLRRFIDGQLLISAQVGSHQANALFAAAALDLSRTGVGHVPGGMGGIAHKLAEAVVRLGGAVHYRQEVVRVRRSAGGRWRVTTKRGLVLEADQVVFNLPPVNVARLLGDTAPRRLRRVSLPQDGWGAFMLYLGVDEAIVPDAPTLHHQLLLAAPVGEGSALFLSFSPSWDKSRAPAGRRALTISAHTRLDSWWRLFETDREGYERRKHAEAERLLAAAEHFLPGLQEAAELILPGTPVTFQRFTRRHRGWVGGFPQTNLFRTRGPRLEPGLWMVGDSIFPGQSVPAVALGGLRVAGQILQTTSRVQSAQSPTGKYTSRYEVHHV